VPPPASNAAAARAIITERFMFIINWGRLR
jgi:hypothetical protein